jgi:predicted RNase H-like nuclease (RuvC/YqgF family)
VQNAALNQMLTQKDLTINSKQEQAHTFDEQMADLRSQLQEAANNTDTYLGLLSESNKQLEESVGHNNLKDKQIQVLEQEIFSLKSMLEVEKTAVC